MTSGDIWNNEDDSLHRAGASTATFPGPLMRIVWPNPVTSAENWAQSVLVMWAWGQTAGRADMLFARCHMLVHMLRTFPAILLCFPQGISGMRVGRTESRGGKWDKSHQSHCHVGDVVFHRRPICVGLQNRRIHLLSFLVSELDLSWEHSPPSKSSLYGGIRESPRVWLPAACLPPGGSLPL